jgi:hemoglobin-like flavoprotein
VRVELNPSLQNSNLKRTTSIKAFKREHASRIRQQIIAETKSSPNYRATNPNPCTQNRVVLSQIALFGLIHTIKPKHYSIHQQSLINKIREHLHTKPKLEKKSLAYNRLQCCTHRILISSKAKARYYRSTIIQHRIKSFI